MDSEHDSPLKIHRRIGAVAWPWGRQIPEVHSRSWLIYTWWSENIREKSLSNYIKNTHSTRCGSTYASLNMWKIGRKDISDVIVVVTQSLWLNACERASPAESTTFTKVYFCQIKLFEQVWQNQKLVTHGGKASTARSVSHLVRHLTWLWEVLDSIRAKVLIFDKLVFWQWDKF